MGKLIKNYQCSECKVNLVITNISDFKIGESFGCAVCYNNIQAEEEVCCEAKKTIVLPAGTLWCLDHRVYEDYHSSCKSAREYEGILPKKEEK